MKKIIVKQAQWVFHLFIFLVVGLLAPKGSFAQNMATPKNIVVVLTKSSVGLNQDVKGRAVVKDSNGGDMYVYPGGMPGNEKAIELVIYIDAQHTVTKKSGEPFSLPTNDLSPSNQYTVTAVTKDQGGTKIDDGTANLTLFGGDDIRYDGTQDLIYTCLPAAAAGAIQLSNAPKNELKGTAQPAGTTWRWITSAELQVTDITETGFLNPTPKGKLRAMAETPVANNVESAWVQLEYINGGVTYTTPKYPGWTALKPTHLELIPNVNTGTYKPTLQILENGNNFYQTQITYQIKDQFDGNFPTVSVSEEFGNWVDDMPNNWPPLSTGGSTAYNGVFRDVLGSGGGDYNWNPPMVFSGDPPLFATKVKHAQQTIRAGTTEEGKGCLIKTHVAQFYRDHADHE